MKYKNISAVFPAHNEECNLRPLIKKTDKILSQSFDDYEIIIVNDGSDDKTKEILDELTKTHPQLKVITHSKNMGYGKAVGNGLAAAQKELVFFSDSDNQFDLAEINLLLQEIDNCDAVIGYRENRQDNLIRSLNAWLWGKINKILFQISVKDINCAFKIFDKNILDKIDVKNLQAEGATINAEILIKLKKINANIKEVSVSHFPRTHGKQSGANPKVIIKALIELTKLR